MKEQQFDATRVINEFGGTCQMREGRTVTQLHLFACNDAAAYPLAGVVDGTLMLWMADGSYRSPDYDHDNDLIMPRHVVAECWQNVYGNANFGLPRTTPESAKETGCPGAPVKSTTLHITLYSDNTVKAEVVE